MAQKLVAAVLEDFLVNVLVDLLDLLMGHLLVLMGISGASGLPGGPSGGAGWASGRLNLLMGRLDVLAC